MENRGKQAGAELLEELDAMTRPQMVLKKARLAVGGSQMEKEVMNIVCACVSIGCKGRQFRCRQGTADKKG